MTETLFYLETEKNKCELRFTTATDASTTVDVIANEGHKHRFGVAWTAFCATSDKKKLDAHIKAVKKAADKKAKKEKSFVGKILKSKA